MLKQTKLIEKVALISVILLTYACAEETEFIPQAYVAMFGSHRIMYDLRSICEHKLHEQNYCYNEKEIKVNGIQCIGDRLYFEDGNNYECINCRIEYIGEWHTMPISVPKCDEIQECVENVSYYEGHIHFCKNCTIHTIFSEAKDDYIDVGRCRECGTYEEDIIGVHYYSKDCEVGYCIQGTCISM